MADFMTMLWKKNISFFSMDTKKNQVAIKYLDNKKK